MFKQFQTIQTVPDYSKQLSTIQNSYRLFEKVIGCSKQLLNVQTVPDYSKHLSTIQNSYQQFKTVFDCYLQFQQFKTVFDCSLQFSNVFDSQLLSTFWTVNIMIYSEQVKTRIENIFLNGTFINISKSIFYKPKFTICKCYPKKCKNL